MGKDNPMQKYTLSTKQQKRLDELANDWDVGSSGLSLSLHLSDLRLLLQHFAPLKQLIRQVAMDNENVVPTEIKHISTITCGLGEQRSSVASAEQEQDKVGKLTSQLQLESGLRAQIETQLEDATAQLSQLQKDYQQLELARQQEHALRLEEQAKCRETKSRLQQLQQDYQTELNALKRSVQSPVTEMLYQDVALANALGLDDMGRDARIDFVRCVAVLSQFDTIKQLWDELKDRCEQQERAVTVNELMLLENALSWHNYNWQQKPYRLYRPTPGVSFDFNRQQRAVGSSNSGELLCDIWLPGISDHVGRLQKKALVVTG